jgi:hypothetical protein
VKRAAAAFVAFFVLSIAVRAGAQACGPRARAWAEACSKTSGATVVAARCPKDRVILSLVPQGASPTEPPEFVEAARDRRDALFYERGIGLLPLGEFPDFRSAPQAVRDALRAAVTCVDREPPPFDEAADGGAPEMRDARPPLPWRLLVGLGLAATLLPWRTKRRRIVLGRVASLVALAAAAFGLAYAAAPWTFFHQNGHGANWIGYALGERCVYGSGYRELLGWAAQGRVQTASCWSARLSAGPERAVFVVDGALVALVPPCAWIICRRAGGTRLLAWAVALALAIDPLLLRIAFSESYYAPLVALSFVGTAIALSACALSPWAPRFAVANVAAGLVLAQAARVHPVAWLALAIVPLAHIGRPGATRRIVRQAAAATLVAGAVVAATSGSSIVALVRGEMGTQYLPEWVRASRSEAGIAATAMIGCVVLAAALPRARSQVRARVLTAGALVAVAALGTSLLRLDVDWVRAAHARLFVAPGVAIAVGLLASSMRRTSRSQTHTALPVAALVAAALVHAAVGARWLTVLSTDALELRLAMAWRARIPCRATMASLERAGIMELSLPVYPPEGTDARQRWVRLDAADAAASLDALGRSGEAFYYRSSLCSTAAGHAWCDALERTVVLEPLEEHVLPARLSANGGGYDTPTVRVGLYRVMGGSR